MPLEGLEHVLSILHSDVERQLPRNCAGFRDSCAIQRRPKTASGEWNAAKMRSGVASRGEGLRLIPEMDAAKPALATS
jgi:hypothetical protein